MGTTSWTMIDTVSGQKAAKDLKSGDEVMTWDSKASNYKKRRVSSVAMSTNRCMVVNLEDGRTIGLSGSHTVYLVKGQWQTVSALVPGDVLFGNNPGIVRSITDIGIKPVVKILVDGVHTYQIDGILSGGTNTLN